MQLLLSNSGRNVPCLCSWLNIDSEHGGICPVSNIDHAAILWLTQVVYCRKLRNDLATAYKDADHHKLLARTVSKSFAAAISENEQLRELTRAAQKSAQFSQVQAQASQQQSRRCQAELHRLQKKLDQSLQLTTTPKAATTEHPKQLHEQDIAAAKRKAREGQQAHPKCQKRAGDQPLQYRHAETQTESSIASMLLDKQQTIPEQTASDMTHPQNNDEAVQDGITLHQRVALIQLELESVRFELLATQHAALHDQDNQHALLPVQCMLQQAEASLHSMTKLHQNMRQTMLSFPGSRKLASHVSQQPPVSKVDSGQASTVHKRQQQNNCEPSGKRQKVEADAAA